MQFRDLAKQYQVLKSDIDNAMLSVAAGAHYIMGPQVKELEQELAAYTGVKYCLTCANGTDALTLALKAWRIGHGINCIQDESYVKALYETQTPLEVCLSSNCKVDRNYAAHPIRYMIERGLKVTINTDNMIFARSDLLNEHSQLRMLGVDDETLMKCTWNALDAAFCDEDTKEYIKEKLLSHDD